MYMIRTYQYRLKTKAKHMQAFAQVAGCRRYVWNRLLKEQIEPIAILRHQEKVQFGKVQSQYPSYAGMCKIITGWRSELAWLKDAPVHTLQQAARDLVTALSRVKDGAGFPKPKRKGQATESFRLPDPATFSVEQDNSRIRVPKIGWLSYYNSRSFVGIIKTLTILKRDGHWFASLQVEVPDREPSPQTEMIGIDRGVVHFATLSTGEFIDGPSPLEASLRKLRIEQRSLARKQKGSNRWRLQRQRVSRLQSKIGRVRKDFLHKASTMLTKNHSKIALEKLEVQKMGSSKNSTLNRRIHDQGWYTFEQMLKYKLAARGGALVHVPAPYTSQQCSQCGYCAATNRKSQALFVCGNCQVTLHADINAACNVKKAGQALLGASKEEHTWSNLGSLQNHFLSAN